MARYTRSASGAGTSVPLPPAGEQIVYVSKGSQASDSNTGRSLGDALSTLAAAVAALGSNPGVIQFGYGTWSTVVSGAAGLAPPSGTVIRGLGELMTTIASESSVTVAGQVFNNAALSDFKLENMTCQGPSSRPGVNCDFIHYDGASTQGTGQIRLNNVRITGAWASFCHSRSTCTTVDLIADRCTIDMPAGAAFVLATTGAANSLSKAIFRACTWLNFGTAASNLDHGIYCYSNVNLEVDQCNFHTNNGTGYGIQHYASGSNYQGQCSSEITDTNFWPACYNAAIIAPLAGSPVPRFKGCTFASSQTFCSVYGDVEFDDCTFLGTPAGGGIVQSSSSQSQTGVVIRVRGGTYTGTAALVTLNKNTSKAIIEGVIAPNVATSTTALGTISAGTGCSIQERNNQKAGVWQPAVAPPATIVAAPTGTLAETFSRLGAVITDQAILTSGQPYCTGIILPAGLTVTNIWFASGLTALSGGSNQWFYLADTSGNILAQTADDTSTAWAAKTIKTLACSAAYVVPTSGMYLLGIMVVASTLPTLAATSADAASDYNSVILPRVAGMPNKTGLTNPASLTGTAPISTSFSASRKLWAGVS